MNNNSIAAFEMTYDAAPISEVFTQHDDIPNNIDNSVNKIGNEVNQIAKSNTEIEEKLDQKNESSTHIMNYIMSNNIRNNNSNEQKNDPSKQMPVMEETDTSSEGPIPVESSSDLVQFMDESNLELKNNIDDKTINDVSDIIKDVINENEIMSEESIADESASINKLINTDNVIEEAEQAAQEEQQTEEEQETEELDQNKILLNKINFLKGDIDSIHYELEKMKSMIDKLSKNTFLSKLNVFIEDNNKNIMIMMLIFVLLIFLIKNNNRSIPIAYIT